MAYERRAAKLQAPSSAGVGRRAILAVRFEFQTRTLSTVGTLPCVAFFSAFFATDFRVKKTVRGLPLSLIVDMSLVKNFDNTYNIWSFYLKQIMNLSILY